MREFQVPQREVPVIVELHDRSERRGTFYAAVSGPGGGPARLIDRLNDPDERFLPLTDSDRGWLLNKEWIVRIAVAADHQAFEMEADAGTRHVEVRFDMAVGPALEGALAYNLPPDRRRLLDYMNMGARFILLQHDGGTSLVNRRFIAQVTDRSEVAGPR